MGPKKAAAAKKKPADDEPGQQPSDLLETYNKFCKRIGIPIHDGVKKALTDEENKFFGQQMIIDTTEKGSIPLGPGGCRALATSIMGMHSSMPRHPETGKPIMYKKLQELRIWKSAIGDDGAMAIAELLRLGGAEVQLFYLELFDNDISAPGAFAIGRSLSVAMNKTLVSLVLDYNRALGRYDLDGNEAASEGVAALCRGIRTNSTLKKLSLKYCDLDHNAGGPLGEMLSFNKLGLSTLDLTGNTISGLGLKKLCPGLRQPGAAPAFTTFLIGDNFINETDEDLEGLAELAAILLEHPILASVNMDYNRIGLAGGEILLPALGPENKKITSFFVDSSLAAIMHDGTPLYDKLMKKAGGGAKGKKGGKKGKKKSDSRAKRNISRYGTSPSGLGLFNFEYSNEYTAATAAWNDGNTDDEENTSVVKLRQPRRYEGAMAQDLLVNGRHDAVELDPVDGMYIVNYDVIDVEWKEL
jgi:hypothetical protein